MNGVICNVLDCMASVNWTRVLTKTGLGPVEAVSIAAADCPLLQSFDLERVEVSNLAGLYRLVQVSR